MKQTKTQSGITLVALIITIIVLLILAIVSIRAIQQGGIIGKAQNAVNSYEDKRKEEENRLNEYENYITKYNVNSKKIEYYVGREKVYSLDYNNMNLKEYNLQDNGKYLLKGTVDFSVATISELAGPSFADSDGNYDFTIDGETIKIRGNSQIIVFAGGGLPIQDGILYVDGVGDPKCSISPDFDTSKLQD